MKYYIQVYANNQIEIFDRITRLTRYYKFNLYMLSMISLQRKQKIIINMILFSKKKINFLIYQIQKIIGIQNIKFKKYYV